MPPSPLVRAAVQGLFAGLAAAACGGATTGAPMVVVPVEPVKPSPIATIPSPPSSVHPVAIAPREKPHDCCRGKNECKGQSGCASSFNDCAGKNQCKATGTACPPRGEPDDD